MFDHSIWRLILHPAYPGSWNMAVDEAILEAAAQRAAPPTLRLYAWDPACLSLGYTQPVNDVSQSALSDHGWELVRRPTGGRAILHTDELTYSVAGPENEPRLCGGVLESYRVLAGALLQTLQRLSIPAEALQKYAAPGAQPTPSVQLTPHDLNSAANGSPAQNPVCFEVPSNYEITVGGKKLIGSAQRRAGGGVLQHGSLPLTGDLRRITWALNFENESERQRAAERLLQRAATCESILGYPIRWETAAEAFRSAFETALNVEFEVENLTPVEIRRAEDLQADKYSCAEWNARI